jgi:dehydrogenase/reductase SDR family member 12
MLRRLVDDAMEFLVIPSFTRIGYSTRRRLYGWEPVSTHRVDGRCIAITGATSGLGLTTARTLADLGASLLLIVRNPDKGERVRTELTASGAAGSIEVVECDLSDLVSVRRAATQITGRTDRIDALIHNAGFLSPTYGVTLEGHEQTFATMVLGPHLLTREVLPSLGRGSRVIWVSSGGMYARGLNVDEVESRPEGYGGAAAYAKAKRAQVVLAQEWARRLRDRRIAVHAMHPGWTDTPGIHEGLPTFSKVIGPLLRDADQGADTLVWLAAAPAAATTTGLFWHDRRARPTEKLPGTGTDERERARLWKLVEQMTSDPMD